MHPNRSRNAQTRAHVDNLLAQVEAQMAEEQARQKEMERARQEAARKKREEEERARREEEARIKREEEERIRREEEERARKEELEQQRLAEMERIRQEEMDRAIQEVEARLRREMEEQLKHEREAHKHREEEELQKRLAEKAALQKSYLEAIQAAHERGRQEAERRLRSELAQLSEGDGTQRHTVVEEERRGEADRYETGHTAEVDADRNPSLNDDQEPHLDDEETHIHSDDAEETVAHEKEASDTQEESSTSEAQAGEKHHTASSLTEVSDEVAHEDELLGAKYLPKSAAEQMAAMLDRAANRPVSQTQIAITKKLLFKNEDPRKSERKQLVRTLGQSGRITPITNDSIADEVADDQVSLADLNFEIPKTKGTDAPQKIETLKRKGESNVVLVEDDEVTSSVSATSSFVVKNRRLSKGVKFAMAAGIMALVLIVSAVTFWSFTHKGWLMSDESSQKPAVGTVVQFEVKTDSGWRLVAMDLHAQGLIDNTSDLIDAVQSQGLEQQLKPGVFNLTVGQTPDEIAQILSHESNSLVHIPEGLTVKQTAEIISQKSSISVDDFMAQAKASNYVNDFPFLKDAYDDSLEGYLFPKSYNLIPGSSADSVIRMMLQQYAEETNGLTYGAVESRNLSQKDLVIIASLIERETARDDERARIASVIYNRLDIKMKLQLCPTVIYALGGKTEPLTYDDLKVDSPYNTYLIDALPPGPICSPSLKSLQAAANPETTDYLFYVSKGDGTHLFTKDYSQFEQGKEEYWNMQGRN